MECSALQRHKAFAHQFGSAINETGLFGAVFFGATWNSWQVGLVGLA
jgi:hypothetical protein